MKLTQNFLALLAFASATIVVANPIPVEADKKRDAAPEPEPTDYGSYSGYGGVPSFFKASLDFLTLTLLRNLSSCRQLFRIWVGVPQDLGRLINEY